MTYNKKQQSYKKGKGISRRRSSFMGSLLKVLLPFVLTGIGIFLTMNLGLESFLFTQNKTELNENIVEEINTEKEEIIEMEEEIEVDEEVEFDEKQYIVSDALEPIKSSDGNFINPEKIAYFVRCEDMTDKDRRLCNEGFLSQYVNSRIPHQGSVISLNRIDTLENWSLRFMVDKEGNITNIKAECGQEHENKLVENRLKNMQPWIPAQHNGKPVNVEFVFPCRIGPNF